MLTDGRDFGVTLGDGHAMVDEHRVEGTCDWMPGMRLATASGNGKSIGLDRLARGLGNCSPRTAAPIARGPTRRASANSLRGTCRRKCRPICLALAC